MASVDGPIRRQALGQTSSGQEVFSATITRRGGNVEVRNAGSFVSREIRDRTGVVLSSDFTRASVADIQHARLDRLVSPSGQSFARIAMQSSLPVELSREAYESIITTDASSYLSQVKFDLSHNGNDWVLSNVQLSRPQNFVPSTRTHFSEDVQALKDDGMSSVHLRHEVPSSLILRDIKLNIENKTVSEIHSYLKRNLPEGSFTSIDEGIQKLATIRFNNFDNLWAGDGHVNMALGNLLHEAYQRHSEVGIVMQEVIFRTLSNPDGSRERIGLSLMDALINGASDWGHYNTPEHNRQVIDEISRIIQSVFR
jgi:hypothetical protein